MRNPEEVEFAIALLEQQRLDILSEEGGAEVIKDMQEFVILDELRRFRRAAIKLIEADERGQGLPWREAISKLHDLVKHKLEN